MDFEKNLESINEKVDIKKEVKDNKIIKTNKFKNDKKYTFLVKEEDVEKVEELIEKLDVSAGEFFRKAISKAFDIKFTGNYKNTGRRGK